MPTHCRLVGRIAMGLLLVLMTAACSGPDLRVQIDNTDGPNEVTVTVDSSAPTLRLGGDVKVAHGEGAEWSVPLGSTWEIKVDGTHVVGSGEVLPLPGPGQDLTVQIRVAPDGTVILVDAP